MTLPSGNLIFHYDPQDSSSLSKAGGGPVGDGDAISQWNDLSGNNYHQVQGTAANRPIYRINGFGTGLPGIEFDGSNDYMSETTMDFNDNAVAIAVLFKALNGSPASSDLETILATRASGTSDGFELAASNGYIHNYFLFLESQYWNGASYSNGTNYMAEILTRNRWHIEVDLYYLFICQMPAHTSNSGLWLGAFRNPTFYGDVKLGELAGWDKTLSAAERTQIVEHFRAKWKLPYNFITQIAATTDDCEEVVSDGSMELTGNVLSMIYSGTTKQEVGYRFSDTSDLPKNATITKAQLRFIAHRDETGVSPDITIYGHDTDNSGTFTSANYNLSSRTHTTANASWDSIPSWYEDLEWLSADVTTIIQEIIDRDGWSSGNALTFIIEGVTSGSYPERAAISYDQTPGDSAYLYIQYTLPTLVSIGRNFNRGFSRGLQRGGVL